MVVTEDMVDTVLMHMDIVQKVVQKAAQKAAQKVAQKDLLVKDFTLDTQVVNPLHEQVLLEHL